MSSGCAEAGEALRSTLVTELGSSLIPDAGFFGVAGQPHNTQITQFIWIVSGGEGHGGCCHAAVGSSTIEQAGGIDVALKQEAITLLEQACACRALLGRQLGSGGVDGRWDWRFLVGR